MKKQLLLTLLALLMLPAVSANADARRIYALGFNNEWYPPTTANADWQDHYNDSNSLFETMPGSNVYEGTLQVANTSFDLYFRFIYGLSDSDDPFVFWRSNVICPKGPARDGTKVERLGTSGAVKVGCDVLEQMPLYDDAGAWRLQAPFYEYFVRVDLNQNMVWLCPSRGFLSVIDNQIPSLETLDKFGNIECYTLLTPGDHTLKIYDLATKQFIAPESDETVDWKTNDNPSVKVSPDNYGAFVVKDWPGGTFLISYNEFTERARVSMTTTARDPMPALDQVYCIGDFCNWSLDDAEMWSADADKTIYSGTLPAGTKMFKFIPERSWDNDFSWDGTYDFTPEGYLKLGISEKQWNFEFPEALAEPARVTVDRVNNCVIVETGISEPIGNWGLKPAPDGKPHVQQGDFLWLDCDGPFRYFTPDATNIDYIWQHIPYMSFNRYDGVYRGSIWEDPGTEFCLIRNFGPTFAENTVIAPPSARSLGNAVNGTFISSYIETKMADAKKWNYGWENAQYQMTLDTVARKITFYAPELDMSNLGKLYLVGSPQGWNINSDAMALEEISPRLYYGSLEIPADAYFRFYTALGDWENNSYGLQWYDEPVDFFFTGDETYSNAGQGKGSWHLTGWGGGTIYMLVNLKYGEAIFSANPIEYGVTPAAPEYDLYMCAPGWLTPNNYYKDENGIVSFTCWGGEVRLFTKRMPMAYDEPETHSSYALSMLDELSFDEADEAKVRFEVIDEETAEPKAKHLILPQNVFKATIKVNLDAMELTVRADEKSGVLETGASCAPEAWYTLQGVRVAEPGEGLYIRVSGGKAEKVLIRK